MILGGESINPPIGQALADAALERQRGALAVRHGARIVAEIELAAVTAQVGFAHVVIGADHAALEDREEVFGRVGMLEAARGYILFGAVVDDAVAVKLAPNRGVDRSFVRHEMRGAIDVDDDQAAKLLGGDVGDVEAANVALALDKRQNGLLRGGLAGGAVASLAADEGFVGLDNTVRPAERAIAASAVHRFADAVTEKPRGLVGHAQHALHLLRAHALLRSGHEMEGEQPLMQGNVAALHDRASADSEFVAAIVAEEIDGLRLALEPRNAERAAMRT